MPKIFGDVTTSANGRLFCKACGYSWNKTSMNIVDISAGHRITCPLCRLVKEKNIRGFVDEAKTFRFIPTPLLNMRYDYLMSQDYLSIDIPVIHTKCNSKFTVKARDLNELIKCPNCDSKGTSKIEKRLEDKGSKAIEYDSDTESKKVENKEIKINQPITENKVSSEDSLKPINKDKNTEIKPKGTKLSIEERMEKARNARKDKRQSQIAEIVNSMKGKVYGKQVIIHGMDSNNQCTCQCIHCGFEMHIPTSQILSKDRRTKAFTCDMCKEKFSDDPNYIDRLINRYIGKVYNGLIITDIYSDEEDITRCDVECLNSKDFISNSKTGHIHRGVIFGELINNKYVCPTCIKSSSNNKLLTRILDGSIRCRNFMLKGYNFNKPGYNMKDGLTLEKIYTTNGYLCDFCQKEGNCDKKHGQDSSFEIIRDIGDRMENLKISAQEVHAKYPNIYNRQDKNANVYRVMQETGLQVFRDAYIGRDGRLYKFCKCSVHRTEMILSEAEIIDFDHSQCTSNFSSNFRFFDVDGKFLLSNSGK